MKIIICVLFLLLSLCIADFLDDSNDFEAEIFWNQFDFIIVGSGASGSIVASRLAEKTNKRILLLEGGRKGTGQRDLGGIDYVASVFKTDPITGEQTLDTPATRYDVGTMWDSIRFASEELDNMWPIQSDGFGFFKQAKIIGGNHASNGLNWYVPLKSDLDAWGGNYSSANFWPFIRMVENATETGLTNNPDRGNAGPINIKFPSFVPVDQTKFRDAFLAAGFKNGSDMAAGVLNDSTIYLTQHNIKNGFRQSSSVAYLLKALKTRSNLIFRTSCTVTELLFDDSFFNPLSKKVIGVKYLNKNGQLKEARATKEVILAVGDLQVPKILYNSGIGPEDILTTFGKKKRVINNIIGQKIRNHIRVSMIFNDSTLVNPNYYSNPAASIQYARTGTGIMETKPLVFAFFNSTDNCVSYCPDIAVTPLALSSGPAGPYGQDIAVSIQLRHSNYANGTLRPLNNDNNGPTFFTNNILLDEADVITLANGIIKTRQYLLPNWNGNLKEVSPGPQFDTVQKLIPWIRAQGSTACHYQSSTPMGTDESAPTDTRMRVKKVQQLRIVGPSVVPVPVFPGMQVLALALGEKGAQLILEDHNLL